MMSDDRIIAERLLLEESPGFTETRYRITSGWGDPRDSAIENKPPVLKLVRVKRRGKSPPHFKQLKWHGKPYRKQDQVKRAKELSLLKRVFLICSQEVGR